MNLPKHVKIVDVGPRDGLQNQPETMGELSKASEIITADVMRLIVRRAGVSYPVLVPNMKGYEAAKAAGCEEVAIFGAASETFSQKNINCTIAESLERFRPVAKAALADGMRVRGYISCVLGCPYEGDVAPAAVAGVARELDAMGCYEVSLGDTIGTGTPIKAQAMIDAVAAHVPPVRLAAHFHDTYGQALANLLAVMQQGVAVIDTAVAGLGGCPYAKGASGNVATEDVLYMLDGLGIETGIDMEKLLAASQFISSVIGRVPASKVAQARLGREVQA